jgi:hypothetical protein
MPRAQRFHLAQTLATVALGAATLAIAYAGQLPALAYGPPPPPPAPGGFQNVVATASIGPAGGVIGPVEVDGCRVALVVPPGTFSTTVQISITAPSVSGVGNGGHPGYRAVCGVGVGITVNGHQYTGAYGHSLILTIAGFLIKPGDRVAVFNGSTFVFTGATVQAGAARISFKGSGEDFVVLAPGGGGGGGGQSPQRGVTAAVRSSHGAQGAVLTSLFFTRAGQSPAGIGVLAPQWLTVISR